MRYQKEVVKEVVEVLGGENELQEREGRRKGKVELARPKMSSSTAIVSTATPYLRPICKPSTSSQALLEI